MNKLQKKMQQLENDLDQTQEALLNANNQLEEKDKALSNVSVNPTTTRQKSLIKKQNQEFFLNSE